MRTIIFLLSLTLAGCSYFGKKEDNPSKNMTVDRLYTEAKSAMEANDFTKAAQLYEFLETRFPFGVYGQQSLLDLAYVNYKIDKPDEAISACNRFIRLYPQNPHVDYAYYLRGLVNFNRGKGLTERFMALDLSQRDASSALQAFHDFSELGKRFPDSQYMDDVKQRMVYLRNLLAQEEINVANYYMKRSAFVAAANRARYIVENYPRTPTVPDALVLMAKAYKVLEMNDLSEDAIRVLKLNYPNHPGIQDIESIEVK
ncbi:MAG: outer membrane protein assembly factor BamD [Gammaproteobacteria bacterium]